MGFNVNEKETRKKKKKENPPREKGKCNFLHYYYQPPQFSS